MGKIGHALKAAAKVFVEGVGPGHYQAGGKPIRCPQCNGEIFREHEALLNTTTATLFKLDWLDKSGTALMCEHCGLIQYYGKRPERL